MEDTKVTTTHYSLDDPALALRDGIFNHAGSWYEEDCNEEGRVVATRLFVQHPRYPECTGLLEIVKVPESYNFSRWVSVRRVISDDGRTPLKAIREVAKRTALAALVKAFQKQGGGRPRGMSDKTRKRFLGLAQDYWDTVEEYQRNDTQILTLSEFAEDRGTSVSTLERALKLWSEERRERDTRETP